MVILLLTATATLSAHLLTQAILLKKTTHNWNRQILKILDTEDQILQKEKKLKPVRVIDQGQWLCFVPDDLSFGCREGYHIFKVEKDGMQSTYVLSIP